jgi:biotin carboxyl carrier protein
VSLRKLTVTTGDRKADVSILSTASAVVDGAEVSFLLSRNGTVRHVTAFGKTYRIYIIPRDSGVVSVWINNLYFDLKIEDALSLIAGMGASGEGGIAGHTTVRAPMPGLITRLPVSPGDRVEKGEAIATLEAMKMENEIRATGSGVVGRITVAVGSTVEKGQILMTLEKTGDNQ